MKTVIIFIILLALLNSCNLSSTKEENLQSTITPPVWIQGDWNSIDQQYKVKFTNNNFFYRRYDEVIDFTNSGAKFRELIITESEYDFITNTNSENKEYRFIYVTENQIDYIYSSSVTVKLLKK